MERRVRIKVRAGSHVEWFGRSAMLKAGMELSPVDGVRNSCRSFLLSAAYLAYVNQPRTLTVNAMVRQREANVRN
jgi:hypothetical protein